MSEDPKQQDGADPPAGETPPKAAWHTLSAREAAEKLETDPSEGLSEKEARRRLNRWGPNQLRQAQQIRWWEVLVRQFKSLVVLLLVAAAVVAFSMHDVLEGIAIVVVILLNAGIGFFTEYRANRAMEALQKLGAADAVLLRGGELRTVNATEIVPGDVLVLQEGDSVPADSRLTEAPGMQVEEASLTGESVPVVKNTRPLDDPDTSLADRTNMVFKGTHVAGGNGRAIVVATGMDTEIGRVSELVTATEDVETPLEQRLARMGRRLIAFCLGVAVIVALAGIVQGTEIGLMIEAAIALAIAAVPEGLPAVATITLAVGMQRMAQRNALIRRLPAVETLGSATCVCTDKTGTLTRNEMMVVRIGPGEREIEVTGSGYAPEGGFKEDGSALDAAEDVQLRALLTAAALCNNAGLTRTEEGDWEVTGDPTEAALVTAAAKADLWPGDLREEHEELAEFPFSSDAMMMGTVNERLDERLREGEGRALCVKGAPGKVAEACTRWLTEDGVESLDDQQRERILERNEELAGEGLRMLGVAFRPVDEAPEEADSAYSELTWLGLVAIEDPPRDEVRETVDILTGAGIKTVMITGDQPATARRIAAALHVAPEDAPVITGRQLTDMTTDELAERIEEVEVFARVSPEQKVDILEALQRRGEICAMLGDGVNDAVALKRADIGVAMGIKGTDVAKETADMVLLDDRFVTVGKAVHQGRIIYDNIRKFIHYLFSCNLSEILTMLLASLLAMVLPSVLKDPLPLLPLQILWLNLITDVFPALALAMEPGEKDVMKRPPRDPDSGLLGPRLVKSIGGYGLLITLSTITAFTFGRGVQGYIGGNGPDPAITMSFLTIGFAQLLHVFNSRKEHGPLRGREWWSNRYVLGAFVLTVALQLAAVYAPGLNKVLKTVPPTGVDWLVIGLCSAMPLTVGQILRRIRSGKYGDTEDTEKD
ncbi:MAG: cation-transporting P-type ATPase [Candidatus Brocadiia bacterium]